MAEVVYMLPDMFSDISLFFPSGLLSYTVAATRRRDLFRWGLGTSFCDVIEVDPRLCIEVEVQVHTIFKLSAVLFPLHFFYCISEELSSFYFIFLNNSFQQLYHLYFIIWLLSLNCKLCNCIIYNC